MSNIFDVEIYNKIWGSGSEGTLIAVLDQVSNIEIVREISKIAKATFEIPRGDVKLSQLDLGKKVKIKKKGGQLEYEGIITGPLDKDQNPVQIITYGKGFLLEGFKFPWSYEFSEIEYDDLINNEFLYERRFFREVTTNDFAEGDFQNTGTINVASGVTPSEEDIWIALSTTDVTKFVTSGTYISDAIDLKTDSFDQVTLIDLDRVRYQAVIGQTGDIGVKVRYAPDSSGSPGVWSSWSASQSLIIEEEMKNLGITTFSAMATLDQWVQVAFEFSSSTAYSNATWYSPVIQAFEIIGKYNLQDFALGSIDSTAEGERITASFDSYLQVLSHIGDIWNIQWEVTNSGTINAQATIGEDKSDQVYLEEEKNCNVISYSAEDEDMTTTVWGLGHGEGLNRLFSNQENYSNSQTYGKRIGIWDAGLYSQTDLDNETTAYRINNDDPIYNIRLEVPLWNGKYFKIGDVIKFVSDPMDIEGLYQVIREVRRETEAGEIFYLDLGNKLESYTDQYVKDQEEIRSGVNDAIKKYESGEIWTGWINADDITWHEININVGWAGEFGKALVQQIHEETSDSYTVAGSLGRAEIVRYTTNGMVIRYRRLNTGVNRLRMEISWEVWSTKIREWREA